MFKRTSKFHWKKQFMILLSSLIIVGGSPAMFAPQVAKAAETESIAWLSYKFDVDDFSDPTQQDLFQLNGNAKWGEVGSLDEGKMVLTENLSSQNGSVFNKEGISPNENLSFSTAFSFEINASSSGDGMTFAIVSDPTKLGRYGGYLGLGSDVAEGRVKPSVAVKFDTFKNTGATWNDPSNNYIGIVVDGDMANYPTDPVKKNWFKDLTGTGHVLSNGNTYYSWVDYDGAAQTLKVYFNDEPTKPVEAFITGTGINLKDTFAGKDKIYAGFTAATGGAAESHKIMSWYFVNEYAPIGSDFGNPETSSGYQQAPSSLQMQVAERVNGTYPVVITAKDAKGNLVADAPISLTSSQNGTWQDADGNPITDWSTVKTDSNGELNVFYIPEDSFNPSDLRAVAVGGAFTTGNVPVAPGPFQLIKPITQLQENKLTWETVEHADKYEVTVKLNDGTVITTETVEGTELDLSTLGLEPGTYDVTVTAKSSDPVVYPDSEESQTVTYNVAVGGKLDQLNPTGNKGQAIGLNPEFDPSQTKYAATVTNDVYSIGINPVAQYPADTEVRVSLNNVIVPEGDWDELPLQVGKNMVTVGVYDKDGNRLSEYTIEIVREPAATAGGKLESLVPSVGSLSPAFDPDQTSYTMSVTNSVYQLQLTPTAIDPEATIAIRVNNGEWKEVASGSISDYLALNVGTNTIDIKVTDKNGAVKEYGVTVTRDSGNSGNNGGNGSNGGSGGGTTSPTTPSTPSTPSTPANDLDVTLNGTNNPFATGTTSTSDGRTTTSVKIEQDKLAAAISEGKSQDLAVHSPKAGDMAVEGLTADTLKQLNDKGASLKVSNLLAIYPVPASNVNLSGVAGQLGNAALNDIAVHIDIKRSSEDLISSAKSKATDAGYELLVDPVDLDLTFSHDGQTVRSGQLDGYAVKYIALPEGIDPNRITTGVIINPDGSVYHVPTVVTEMNNRYFARINDLRSSGSYSVIWNPQDFADVKSHWGKEDVNNIAARLDLKGNGDNTFSPDRSVTRSEFAEIVVLGLGLMRSDAPNANFPDVSANAWYGNAVAIANEFDIVRGYDNGSFNGGQQITREQGFAMIARAYRLIQSEGLPGQEQIASTLAKYEDGASVAAWAKADIAQLIAAGIIQGNGPELLSPKTQMTRAEVTALMARMLKATNLIDK